MYELVERKSEFVAKNAVQILTENVMPRTVPGEN